DYIALTGALHAIGGREAPTPPLNLLGDFGGGAMALAFGVVCALLEAQRSGRKVSGATSVRPTRSTVARRSTASTAAPTASGSPSARWSRNSSTRSSP